MRQLVTREAKRLGSLVKRRITGQKIYFDKKKYKNYLKNSLEYQSRKVILETYPYRLYIDPINICNLQCPLCPTGRKLMPSQGKMSPDTFRRIIDIFKDYAQWVGLYNWGEPLLHPDIFEMVQYIAKNNTRSMISSNFSVPFSESRAEEMIKARLSRLVVSMDGATRETYEQYRVGGNFDKVITNLHILAEAKLRKNSSLPDVVLQFIVFRHNEHEIGQIEALAKRVGARASITSAICDMGTVAETSPQEAAAKHGEWLPSNSNYRRYDELGNWLYNVDVCHSLWNTTVFRWDGEVFPCCLPYKDQDSFGNINENSFEEIWNNQKYQHARSLFLKTSAINSKCSTVCDACYKNKAWNVQRPKWFEH
jgi:radical SAM protein with 4Fe4S-binding SPASM domain